MTEDEMAVCVSALVHAHRNGTMINSLPAEPSSIADAHAIQDQVAAQLGEPIGAFKANAPPDEEPVRGLIFTRMIRASPARISSTETPHLGVEAEIAFRFTRDLPPRSAKYTREDVAGAAAVLPAIEVVSGRLREPQRCSALARLADRIANGAFVPGKELLDWSDIDLPNLKVALRVNDAIVVEHRGGHPIGDPLGVALSLVNMMRQGSGVRAGQMVTTGTCTGLRFLKTGDRCTVQFERLGSVDVTF